MHWEVIAMNTRVWDGNIWFCNGERFFDTQHYLMDLGLPLRLGIICTHIEKNHITVYGIALSTLTFSVRKT